MYNEKILFDLEKDSLVTVEKNGYSGVWYNERHQLGSRLVSKDVPYIEFPELKQFDFLKHGFSTRLGGVSEGAFQTLNLSYSRGDVKESVTENYKRILGSLHMNLEDVVFSDQVHDTKIHVASKKDCQGTAYGEKKLAGIDGLITNEKDVVLCTTYADCVPLFFADPKNKAIGAAHSGWKGTVGKIGAKTIQKMAKEYGTKAEDLHCVIGPSICVSCYEVSKDVIDQIEQNFTGEIIRQCVFPKENGKYQLDLWMLNQQILIEAGMPKERVSISNVCTCCNHTLLFSHRASGGKRGNLCGFIALA
ncbi:peptidoglycan editing factor PgeF [[Clostridium] polysaccharolyticum]|uniref:Purine nucleoside phosphorylase n=1 Tax=[Clostridium] polysaccharolyticum TaxID=29364 RepID=A0A1I0FJF3_9FIRM|nr:peptidoglycan editing factor PgeF [[Clostridium] polysaccharolyticum]SET57662.1 conserved hypothetical protein [[Clostridium] polysaccharolyticum]